MTVALPVRPVPAPGEPLTSYAARLADANGLTRSRVLPAHRHDVDVPAGELDTLAALAGLDPAAAAQLTMDRYPPTVRGQGVTHRGGWRLHFSADWICPRCTPRTGRRELLWQTALSPMCRHCNVLLVPATTAPAGEIVDAPRDLTGLVDELVELAEASITHHSARVRLGRFRRLCALIAQTIDDTWPHRHDSIPPVDEAAARAWGAFPSADPATVAAILVSAAPALHSTASHDQLSREGHARRRGTPTRHPRKYLPQRPPAAPRRPIVAGFNATDSGRLRWFLTQLEHQVARHGIRPEHVPALLPHPDDDGLPNPRRLAHPLARRPRAAHAAHPNLRRLALVQPRRPRLRRRRHRHQPAAGRRPPRPRHQPHRRTPPRRRRHGAPQRRSDRLPAPPRHPAPRHHAAPASRAGEQPARDRRGTRPESWPWAGSGHA
jgi:hypothetical protein